MRVVLSGGGTGGHIYPALSLKKAILEQEPDSEFLYIGTKRGLESNLVPQTGTRFETIDIQGLRRSLSLDNIRTVYKMVQSVRQSRKILKEFNPDVVIGTGGYVCAPVLYAASKLHIPTLIHEPNSVAGITNKFLARYVDRICISFDDVRQDFKRYADKIVRTGNPRGQEVVENKNVADLTRYGLKQDKKTVLVFSGSLGAQRINEIYFGNLEELDQQPYQTLIVTGQLYYDEFRQKYVDQKILKQVVVVPYIQDMPNVLNAVDLIVSRSGATTITEITALGKASILIPSPNVTHNHQYFNAKSLSDHDAAVLIKEEELNKMLLFEQTRQLIEDETKRLKMEEASKALGVPDASNRIIHEIHQLI